MNTVHHGIILHILSVVRKVLILTVQPYVIEEELMDPGISITCLTSLIYVSAQLAMLVFKKNNLTSN
jgi:hypothetical protein